MASSSLALAATGPLTRLQFTQFLEDRPTPVVDAAVHVVPCAPVNATCRELLNDLTAPFRGSRVWTGTAISQAVAKAEGQLVVQKGHRLLRTDAAGSVRLACPTANCLVFAASTAAGRTVVWSFLQPFGRSRELLPSAGLSVVAAAPAADPGARKQRWIAAATLATPLLLAVLLLVVLLERRELRRRSEELLSTLRAETKFEIATLNVAVEAIRSVLVAIEQGGVQVPAVPTPPHGPEADHSDQLQSDQEPFDQIQSDQERSDQEPSGHEPSDQEPHDQEPFDQQPTEPNRVISPRLSGDSQAVAAGAITTLEELEQASIEARRLRLALDQSAALLQNALAIQPQAEQVADRLQVVMEEARSLLPSIDNRLMEMRAAGRSAPPPQASIEPIPPASLEPPPASAPSRSDRVDASKGTRLGQVLPIASHEPIRPTDPPPA